MPQWPTMATHRARTRPPRGRDRCPPIERDADLVRAVLEDAAHFPGGYAAGVVTPESEAEVAAVLRGPAPVLPIGAQSSLTGGATPFGEVVLRTTRLASILSVGSRSVRVQPGVVLSALQAALQAHATWYPPVPTYTGACCGGVVATNAAGPTTFKYGTTRDWVLGLTIVLPCGEVLEIARGEVVAHDDGHFLIETSVGAVRVPVPPVPLPDVPKRSAGYPLAPRMDLVDLFVGSEGTLGVITEIELRLAATPAATCQLAVPCRSEAQAVALVACLRRASLDTRARHDPRGLDVTAIEHVDRRSLELAREDGVDRKYALAVPAGTEVLLLAEIELADCVPEAAAWQEVAGALAPNAPDTPLTRLARLLVDADVATDAEIVLPGQTRRAGELAAFREAVPMAVNQRVAQARERDARITKVAGDVVVPFERFTALMEACRVAFRAHGLDHAVWGHISDGNIHPNVIPATYADVQRGQQAVLDLGREVVRLGGCPLAEHGVGRNPVKKALLALVHGEDGLRALRVVKAALDPAGRLAPGVLL